MAARYKHYPKVFGQQVLRAGFMRAAMLARAEVVKAAAEAIAPVGDPDSGWYPGPSSPAPGTYAAAFSTSTALRVVTLDRSVRWVARVHNNSQHAAAVEFGFGRTPKYRVLGRALGAAGGDVKLRY